MIPAGAGVIVAATVTMVTTRSPQRARPVRSSRATATMVVRPISTKSGATLTAKSPIFLAVKAAGAVVVQTDGTVAVWVAHRHAVQGSALA